MPAQQALPVRFPFQVFEDDEPDEFVETSAIDAALLGGVTTGEEYSFALTALDNPITGYEHVVVVAFRNVKPEPLYDGHSPIPMAVRNRAYLSRRGTFLIAPYNKKLEIVGRWQTEEKVLAINRDVVEVSWEHIYHQTNRAGANVKPFLVWYHFPYTTPLKNVNMRDMPLQYAAWNLATILMEWKQADVGMGTFEELYRRLVDAGLPEYSDLAVQGASDTLIRECVTIEREYAGRRMNVL
ncbi:MAG: hypothetical protein Q9162_007627 [Coniocarpon cinnabarinum]